MKKVVSIFLAILMLTAVLHFSVATHYCGGTIAATKISFAGKLASCGMKNDEKAIPQTGLHFTTHCCDNILFFFVINSNYFPSFSSVYESYQHIIYTFNVPDGQMFHSLASVKSISTNVSPPDTYGSTSVDLSAICVFRI